MSPRSQPSMKRPYYDTLLENNLILSPRSDDCDNLGKPCVQPLSEVKPSNIEVRNNQLNAMDSKNATDTDKPMCSIKLIRRYVEEDDAASVITSEEGMLGLLAFAYYSRLIGLSLCSDRRLHITRLPYIVTARSPRCRLLRHADGIKNVLQKIAVSHCHRDPNHIRSRSIYLLRRELYM